MLDQGAGTHTAMRLVAAEELQVPLKKVRVATLDTSEVGPDTGIGASRGTRIFGNATGLAAAHAKDQLIDAASKELGVARDALRLSGDGAVCAASGARVSYGDIARMRNNKLLLLALSIHPMPIGISPKRSSFIKSTVSTSS